MTSVIERIPNEVGSGEGENNPLVRYQQDLQKFLIRPEVCQITDRLFQISKDLATSTRDFDGAVSPLETHVAELRKQRVAEQRLASQVAARFNNDRGSLKRRAYDAFSRMKLQPVAELLYPLETTRSRYRQTDRQISQAEADLETARGNIWQNQATLQSEKTVLEQKRQQAIEGWVLQGDSSRVLCYALENLTDNPRGRERLFQAFAVQTGTSLPLLNAEFEDLIRQPSENKETPRPVVEWGDAISEESQPDNDYQPVDWREWGRAFLDSGWYRDDGSQEHVVLEEGTVCTLGMIQRPPDGKPYIKILTPDETNELLTRQAEKLARGDLRMLADCQAMIDSLRKDPYGQGTKKLSAREATLDHQSLPWRSLNPARRPGLRLRHEFSKQLRIIYVVVKQNGKPPIIILEGEINPHGEYDRKTARKIAA